MELNKCYEKIKRLENEIKTMKSRGNQIEEEKDDGK